MKNATMRLIEAVERSDSDELHELATLARLEQHPAYEANVRALCDEIVPPPPHRLVSALRAATNALRFDTGGSPTFHQYQREFDERSR